jgi:hypothetical protein
MILAIAQLHVDDIWQAVSNAFEFKCDRLTSYLYGALCRSDVEYLAVNTFDIKGFGFAYACKQVAYGPVMVVKILSG